MSRGSAKRYRQNRHPVAWTILSVGLVAVLLPIVVLFIWCFAGSWMYPDLLPDEWTLRGWTTIFEMNNDLPQTIALSVGISLAVAVISTAASFFIARALALYEFKGKRVVDFLALVPLCMSATALAMGVHVYMLRAGLANSVVGVVLVHLIIVMPYSIKLLTDPLRLMGTRLSEQARNLGAGGVRAFFSVELFPLLPSLLASVNLGFIVSFGQYFLTFIIGGGKVVTLAVVMASWISASDRTLAASYAVVYLIVTLLVFALIDLVGKLVSRRRKNYLM